MMQSQPTSTVLNDFPLHELEQIEDAIGASSRLLAIWIERRNVLRAELDRITFPQICVPRAPSRLIGPGFEYRGEMKTYWSLIDLHVNLLRRLWTDFPDRRQAMANAMGSRGLTRTYVAQTPTDLFPGKSLKWTNHYSRDLVDGWHADTHLNRERVRTLLPVAVAAAGLKWGTDVKARWRSSLIPRGDQRVGE